MTLEQFIQKVASDRQILANAVQSMSEEIASSTLTLIKDRSINEGIIIGGDPSVKAKYSTRQVKTEKFKGKELSKKGSAWIEANAMGTWHDFRKAQGLRSEDVNLSYTNEMWRNIQVIKTQLNGEGKASTVVGSYDDDTNEKIENLSYRFGEFLKPSPDELRIQQEVQREKILKLLRL